MKKLIMVLAVLISGMSAQAQINTSSESQDLNPTIAYLRQSFLKGTALNKDQLLPGSKWKCLRVGAVSSKDPSQEFEIFSFSSFDGLMLMGQWDIDGAQKYPPERQYYQTFAFAKTGLVGSRIGEEGIIPVQIVFRLAVNGTDLVGEWSITEEAKNNCSGCDELSLSSIYDSRRYAAHYMICPKENILN